MPERRIGGGEAAIRSGRARPRLGNRTGRPGGSDKRASGPINGAVVMVGECWLARCEIGAENSQAALTPLTRSSPPDPPPPPSSPSLAGGACTPSASRISLAALAPLTSPSPPDPPPWRRPHPHPPPCWRRPHVLRHLAPQRRRSDP
ncbi:hypothetical protein PVAP13_3NG026490 [Panicum virgatum]|uniref:Uncharacterized protein n=1 Tax=Panicum virgatum TaxID=38727 RepID=A0A8T0U2F7_PANVG|nr:hypothetical protein PVAP13_3NG026490 [Panicum virgatum]